MNRIQKLINDNKITVIGITGGVGSGKSTILEFMKERYNASVYIADAIGHKVMQMGNDAYLSIVETFGADILKDDLDIDRVKLGVIVFENEEKLKMLNAIIHPEVKKYIINGILEEYNKDGQKLFIVETAILYEVGYQNMCTETWYIHVDKCERMKRLMASRGYSVNKCESIISNQLSDEEFIEKCDFVINNGNDLNITKNQIENHMNFCYNSSID